MMMMMMSYLNKRWNNHGDADVRRQMAQVERLESKLNLMVFMGQFDELVTSLRPVWLRSVLYDTSGYR